MWLGLVEHMLRIVDVVQRVLLVVSLRVRRRSFWRFVVHGGIWVEMRFFGGRVRSSRRGEGCFLKDCTGRGKDGCEDRAKEHLDFLNTYDRLL